MRYDRVKPMRARLTFGLCRAAIAGIASNAMYWSAAIVDRSRSPRHYDGYRFRHTAPPADWSYPIEGVATWVAVIAIEAVALSWLLWRARGAGPGRISFALAVLCTLATLFFGMMAMHAPLPVGVHVVSLFYAAAWLLAIAVISGVAWLVTKGWRRAPEEAPAGPPEARVVRGQSG
jgi:hypothetical protein